RRRCPFSNRARRFFSEPQGFQAFGLGAFGFALCFVLGHGFGAFGGSLFLFELRFRPFPLLGVVGQRSLLLSLETRSSYSSRCRCASRPSPPRDSQRCHWRERGVARSERSLRPQL